MSKLTAISRYFLLSAFVLSNSLFSQTKTLTRKYDPIIYRMAQSPLNGIAINELFAYKYDTASGQWAAIPFQIDEIDSTGKFLFDAGNGVVDSTDEVVFMPDDTWDQAPTSKWLNDSGAMQNTRIELEMTDPIDGKKGWIYLYRKLSSPPDPASYFTYSAATEKGNDRITGKSYSEANDTSGWYIDARVLSSVGGNGEDFIDRQKVLIEGTTVFTGDLKLRETDLFSFIGVKENFSTGKAKVRGLRELSLRISLAGLFTTNGSIIKQFFPYSSLYRFQGIDIPDLGILGKVSKARISIDLNQHAGGMKFLNQTNRTGVTVDGVADNNLNKMLLPAPELNWFMVTGVQGTMLVLAQVPQIGETRLLYYNDDSTPNPEDSGDQLAYGDFLYEITQQTGSIKGKFDFEIITYYFEPVTGDPAVRGDQFKAWHGPNNLLKVDAREQLRTTTSVTDKGGQPSNFVLDDAQPNPYWQQSGTVRLSFTLPQGMTSPSLRVYNLIGQEIASFDFKGNQTASSKYQVQWDGRAANGQMLPAGIYFYQLRSGAQVATKKLVLIR